jgi:hypothetical protein
MDQKDIDKINELAAGFEAFARKLAADKMFDDLRQQTQEICDQITSRNITLSMSMQITGVKDDSVAEVVHSGYKFKQGQEPTRYICHEEEWASDLGE